MSRDTECQRILDARKEDRGNDKARGDELLKIEAAAARNAWLPEMRGSATALGVQRVGRVGRARTSSSTAKPTSLPKCGFWKPVSSAMASTEAGFAACAGRVICQICQPASKYFGHLHPGIPGHVTTRRAAHTTHRRVPRRVLRGWVSTNSSPCVLCSPLPASRPPRRASPRSLVAVTCRTFG